MLVMRWIPSPSSVPLLILVKFRCGTAARSCSNARTPAKRLKICAHGGMEFAVRTGLETDLANSGAPVEDTFHL